MPIQISKYTVLLHKILTFVKQKKGHSKEMKSMRAKNGE